MANKAKGKAPGGPNKKHSTGFDEALTDALNDADNQWGAGNWDDVTVELRARVETHSPGVIHEYKVILTKP
jgi:hypothetical protein